MARTRVGSKRTLDGARFVRKLPKPLSDSTERPRSDFEMILGACPEDIDSTGSTHADAGSDAGSDVDAEGSLAGSLDALIDLQEQVHVQSATIEAQQATIAELRATIAELRQTNGSVNRECSLVCDEQMSP